VTESNLKVMTFNLLTSTKKRRSHPWRLRKRNIARLIMREQPDVIGTQEANLSQLMDLAALLPGYDYIGEGNLGRDQADDESSWYCATFYRRERVRPLDPEVPSDVYWLSPTPDVPASQFIMGTRPRLVTWTTFETVATGRTFVFGTTHLEAINSWHRRRSAQQLREQVSGKVAELGPDVPVFLTGDFNAVSTSREIRAMGADDGRTEPMHDAWNMVKGGGNDLGTFRGLGLRDRVSHKLLGPRRIDYVFFRGKLAVRSIDCLDFSGMDHREAAVPSDHFPVMAEFDLAV